MIRYFQSAYISRYIIALLLLGAFWIPSFITLALGGQHGVDSPWQLVGSDYYALLLTLGSVVVSLVTALAINQVSSGFGISSRISTLSALVYVILGSSLTLFTEASPFLLINLLIVLLIRNLFFIPQSKNQPILLFNTGFLVGTASLFAPTLVFFLAGVWIALMFHRSGSWRNFMSSLTGLMLPWVFIWMWFFWYDRLQGFYALANRIIPMQILHLHSFSLHVNLDLVLFFCFTAAALVASLSSYAGLRSKSINLRHNIAITITLLVMSYVVLALSENYHYAFIFTIPATLMIVNFLEDVRYRKIYDILLVTFILLGLINQYSVLVELIFQ